MNLEDKKFDNSACQLVKVKWAFYTWIYCCKNQRWSKMKIFAFLARSENFCFQIERVNSSPAWHLGEWKWNYLLPKCSAAVGRNVCLSVPHQSSLGDPQPVFGHSLGTSFLIGWSPRGDYFGLEKGFIIWWTHSTGAQQPTDGQQRTAQIFGHFWRSHEFGRLGKRTSTFSGARLGNLEFLPFLMV